MTFTVRRIVTGHDSTGKSVISSDEQLAAQSRGAGEGIAGPEIWSTNRMPIDNSPEAEAAQMAGFVRTDVNPHNNYVGTGTGTAVRIVEWRPGHPRFTHRTETLDYSVVLQGEIDLELDEGEVVHLTAGDIVVQRGGLHTWMNRGNAPAVTLFVLNDATPVVIDGEEKRTHFPS